MPSLKKDVWKVAAIDRIHGSKRKVIGFLENFGANIGAFASTWSFHENDLIVIGSNDSDMALAANSLKKTQGGLVVATSGKIQALLPLQFAGIISTDSRITSYNVCYTKLLRQIIYKKLKN